MTHFNHRQSPTFSGAAWLFYGPGGGAHRGRLCSGGYTLKGFINLGAKFKGVRSGAARSCTSRKPNHDFPIPVNRKFCSILHRLVVIWSGNFNSGFSSVASGRQSAFILSLPSAGSEDKGGFLQTDTTPPPSTQTKPSSFDLKLEKPTNCGTKAADVRIQWIFWCIRNYYDFATPTNSKCCSICYRLVVI